MGSIGAPELFVILVVALIVLGPTRLPDAARSVGRAMTEFRRMTSGFQAELRDALEPPVIPADPPVFDASVVPPPPPPTIVVPPVAPTTGGSTSDGSAPDGDGATQEIPVADGAVRDDSAGLHPDPPATSGG